MAGGFSRCSASDYPTQPASADPSQDDLQEAEGEPVSATLTVFMPLVIR